MGFMVDKVALRQVCSEFFGFPFQFSFQLGPYLLIIIYIRRYIVSILTESLNKQFEIKIITMQQGWMKLSPLKKSVQPWEVR
jgi:hypothetical protein